MAAGRYEVFLHEQTPLTRNTHLPVRICHAEGEKAFGINPHGANQQSLGVYNFSAGNQGYVEFHAEGSKGSVVADAVLFRLVPEN